MTNFDETKVRRDQGGKFTNKSHAEAQVDLDLIPPPIEPDPIEDMTDAAHSENTDPDTLDELSDVEVVSVQVGVAGNKNARPQTIGRVVAGASRFNREGAHRIFSAAASNPYTPVETLRMLSRSTAYRDQVLANPGIEGEVERALDNLRSDEFGRVALASNAALGESVQDSLSDPEVEGSWRVRESLAGNIAVSGRVLKKLSKDPHTSVRSRAKETLSAWAGLGLSA